MAHNPSQQYGKATDGNESNTKTLRLRLAVVACLLVLLAGFLLLPTLISTAPGTHLALKLLNARIAGQVDIDDLNISWFGPQHIDGFHLRDSDKVDILSARQVTAPDISLFSAALGTGVNGHVKLASFVAKVEHLEDGTTNVQRAFAGASGPLAPVVRQTSDDRPPHVKTPPKTQRDFRLSIEAVDAQVTYKRPDGVTIVTNMPTAVFDLSNKRKFIFKAQGTITQGGQTGQMQVNVLIKNLFDIQGSQTLDRAEFNASAKLQAVPVAGLDAMIGLDGMLLALLGPRVDGGIEVKGNLSNLSVTLDATTQNFSILAHATGRDDHVELHSDRIALTVTPEAWSHWSKHYTTLAGTTIQEPVVVVASIKELNIPLDKKGKPILQLATVSSNVQATDLSVDAGDRLSRLELHGAELSLASDAIGTAVSLAGSTVVLQASRQGKVGLNINVRDLFDSAGKVNTRGLSTRAIVNLTDLPITLLDQFAPALRGITQVVGPVLSAKLEARLKPIPEVQGITGPITISATSDHLNANLNLVVQEDFTIVQELGQISSVELMLTPRSLDQLLGQIGWDNPKPIKLVQPSRLYLTVQGAQISWVPEAERAELVGLPFDLNHSKLIATLTADTRALRLLHTVTPYGRDIEMTRVREIRIKLNAPNARRQIDVDVEATFDASIDDVGPDITPMFMATNHIRGLIDSSGDINVQSATIVIKALASLFPVAPLDALLRHDGKLLELLGPTATFTLEVQRTANIHGTLLLSLESDNARTLVEGTIEPVNNTIGPRWRLALTQDLQASLAVTPELGKRYLAPLNPLLADVHSAEKPIALTISKEGFEATFDNLDLDGLKMQGQMELGTLRMRQGSIGRALAFGLRAAGSSITDRPQFDATFTTLHFTIGDGVIESDDLWMDTGDLLLGTQARVHRANKRGVLHANALMGIPGETVRLIPQVSDRIRPEALFTLPVSGPLDKLEPDFLSLLLPIATEAALGEAGGGVGQLIGIIGAAVINRPKKSIRPRDTNSTWDNVTWDNRPAVDRHRTDSGGGSPLTAVQSNTPGTATKKKKNKERRKKKTAKTRKTRQ